MRQRSPGVHPVLSLAWLLEPLSVDTFLDELWGKAHHDYRLADGSLDVAAVRNDFADGYTIVMDGIEQYMRTIGTLARSVEVELNFPTQVNAYIAAPQSSGLVPHYDDYDGMVLQIQGSKSWHLLVRRGTCPPVGKITSANAIDGQTWVVKHQPIYAHVKTFADGVTLQFASLSIAAGADHEHAMRFVARSVEPFRVGELPGLRSDQQTEIARTLIVSGFLTPLTKSENS
jgi:hypothetical protein